VAEEDWVWAIAASAYGYPGMLQPLAGRPVQRAVGNRVNYVWDNNLAEWFINDRNGLKQGFTIGAAPIQRQSNTALLVQIALSTNLTPYLTDDAQAILFRSAGGETVLRYDGLLVTDARGQALPAYLSLSQSEISIWVDDSAAIYPITIDPWVQRAKLTASDGASNDRLGYSVSMSGDTVVVGAPYKDVYGNADQGAAYVFVKPDTGWADITETATLTASDGVTNDLFGFSVSISGDTIVVGAPDADVGGNADMGAAYVYRRPTGGWADMTETGKLTTSDGTAHDLLGQSVAISGDTVVVGAHQHNVGAKADQGAAYVFVKPSSGWAVITETAMLTASNGTAGDNLGYSVSISGDTVVVGAQNRDVGGNTNQGSAYVFERPLTGWVNVTETATLTASDGAADDRLGVSVSISEDTIVVGARGDDIDTNVDQGSAYVYQMPVGGWADMTETSSRP